MGGSARRRRDPKLTSAHRPSGRLLSVPPRRGGGRYEVDDELGDGDLEGDGEPPQDIDAGTPAAPLDLGDVGAVHVGRLSEIFLRPALCLARRADRVAEESSVTGVVESAGRHVLNSCDGRAPSQ